MKPHPVANIFPPMPKDEFKGLVEDIRRNGQLEPGMVYRGRIVDGVHREWACQELGIKFQYNEWPGEATLKELADYVLSENLKRRHLDAGQRAMIVAQMDELVQQAEGEAQKRQNEGREKGGKTAGRGRPIASRQDCLKAKPHQSRDDLAALAGVGSRTMQDAITVHKKQPKLSKKVSSGKMTLSDAVSKVTGKERKPKQKNPALYRSTSCGWLTPPEIIERVVKVLGTVDLDPCSDNAENPNVPCRQCFTRDNDGLIQKWRGKVYMNPPYGSELPNWIEKLLAEFNCGHTKEAVALVPSRTDTQWFRSLRDFPRCFIWGRLKFSSEDTPATFPSMAVYLGKNQRKFVSAFKDIGDVYVWLGKK